MKDNQAHQPTISRIHRAVKATLLLIVAIAIAVIAYTIAVPPDRTKDEQVASIARSVSEKWAADQSVSKLNIDRAYAQLISMTLVYDRIPVTDLEGVRSDMASAARMLMRELAAAGRDPKRDRIFIWVGAEQVGMARRLGNTTYDWSRDTLYFQRPD
jgi:hypothetical protein